MRIPSLRLLKRRCQLELWKVLVLSALVYYVAKSYHINVQFDGDPDLPGGADDQVDAEVAIDADVVRSARPRGVVQQKRAPKNKKPKLPQFLRIIQQNGTTELRPRILFAGASAPDYDHMHGQLGFFADGSPGYIQRDYPSVNDETEEQKKVAHNPNCFNLARSDSLPLSTPVPDVRHAGCKAKTYPPLVPASVVMVFFNEPLSPLLRSITSVLDRTPPELLKEIILVDDGSDRDYTQEPLERYLQLLPKVTLRRMPKRQGLMATRVEGGRIASSEILVYLDSHIECNNGWIEPMIYRIMQNWRNVVTPIIDSIDPDTMEYKAGGLDILAFDWTLKQAFPKRKMDDTEPTESPGMGGGLFAVNRTLFFDLGGYDPGMKLYGGEEVEFPMRIWQCGNRLECVPCSRVGHIFRSGQYHHGQVYPVPGHVITKNHLRAAKMWMEPKYFDLVKRANGPLPAGVEIGDISWGTEIKERLKCKGFQWFLDNVYPEMFIPGDPKFVRLTGAFRNPEKNICLDSLGRSADDSKIGAYPCHTKMVPDSTQTFILTVGDEIRISAGMYKSCLDRANKVDGVYLWGCHGGKGNQEWMYAEGTKQLRDGGNQCVELWHDGKENALRITPCKPNAPSMEWVIDVVPDAVVAHEEA